MATEQTLFFTCPHCEERFAQVEEPDRDIHTGEIYYCANCGIQVIFQAMTVEDYVPPPRARRDCYFCQPEPCRFGPGSGNTDDTQRATVLKVKRNDRRLPESGRARVSDA